MQSATTLSRPRSLPRLDLSSPDLPFQVSHSLNRHTGEITLRLKSPAQFSRRILDALGFLSDLAGILAHESDKAERARRVSAENVAWAARLDTIRGEYSALRNSGLLHRAAVRALVSCPRFSDLGWRFADFNRVVPSSASWNSHLHNRPSESLRVVR